MTSLILSYTVPQVAVMISIPSTSPRPDAHRRTIQESYQHWPFHIISSKSHLIALLKYPSSVHASARLSTHSAVTLHCLGGTGPCHLIGTIFASRWPAPSSMRRRAAAFKTRPVTRSNVFVTALTVFLAAAEDTPHSNQTHSHLVHAVPITLSLVNPFVPMSAMFDSVGTCFVANFFSSIHNHFTSMWRHSQLPTFVPRHDLQQSHSETFVFSSVLQLRDKRVSSTDLALLQSFASRILSRLMTSQ